MTRTLAALGLATLSACGFEADYAGGTYRCGDGACPAGLACVDQVCIDPAALDAPPPDTPAPDGPPPDAAAALGCGDPGPLARAIDEVRTGTTAGATNHVSSMCAALGVFNGPDHVFRATAQAGDDLTVTLDAAAGVRAYVLAAACPPPPATPTCVGDDVAVPGVPLALTGLTAGDVYVVVDDVNPAGGGTYELTVRLGP